MTGRGSIRLTRETASHSVRTLVAELARTIHDAGPRAARELSASADRLAAALSAAPVAVDVVDGGDRQVASAGPHDNGDSPWTISRVSAQPEVRALGAPRAPVLLWPDPDAGALPRLEPLMSERPVVLHGVHPGPAPEVRRRLEELAWLVLPIDLPSGAPLDSALSAVRGVPHPDLLRAAAATAAAASLLEAFEANVRRDLQAVRTRRSLLQHHASRDAVPAERLPESFAELRAGILRQIAEFSRGVQERLEDALAPQGPLAAAIGAAARQIVALEEEPRVRTMAMRVAPPDEQRFLAAVRGGLLAQGMTDLQAARDLARLIDGLAAQAMRASGCPPPAPLQPMSDERLRRLVSIVVSITRAYQGERPRPGFFEYAMLARRYQMVLVMMLSAFGVSLVRSFRDVMLPLATLLLSLGALQVVHAAKRSRVEQQAQQLERARDTLKADAARAAAHFVRDWPGMLVQHLQDQSAMLLEGCERAFRAQAARAAADAASGRQMVQRQLQALDGVERRLSVTSRGRDALAASLAQLRGELRQLIAAGAPAVEGAQS
jgi:hypothetical protein